MTEAAQLQQQGKGYSFLSLISVLNSFSALTEMRKQSKDERDKAIKLLKEDFAARLPHELEAAFERGKAEGEKEGRLAAKALMKSDTSSADVTKLKDELKKLQAKQKDVLKNAQKEAQENLTDTVKGIVNSTFKVCASSFIHSLSY